jgi:excisionase family DNA binding protein
VTTSSPDSAEVVTETRYDAAPMIRYTRTIAEVSKLLGISQSLAYQLVRTGEIPSVKIGGRRMVTVAALEEILQMEKGSI